MKNSVDEEKDRLLGFIATVAEVLNSEVVKVTGFPWLPFGEEYVIQLVDVHWVNFKLVIRKKIKDVEIIKLAKIVEASVEFGRVFIRLAKIFCICSESLKYIFTMIRSNRCVGG